MLKAFSISLVFVISITSARGAPERIDLPGGTNAAARISLDGDRLVIWANGGVWQRAGASWLPLYQPTPDGIYSRKAVDLAVSEGEIYIREQHRFRDGPAWASQNVEDFSILRKTATGWEKVLDAPRRKLQRLRGLQDPLEKAILRAGGGKLYVLEDGPSHPRLYEIRDQSASEVARNQTDALELRNLAVDTDGTAWLVTVSGTLYRLESGTLEKKTQGVPTYEHALAAAGGQAWWTVPAGPRNSNDEDLVRFKDGKPDNLGPVGDVIHVTAHESSVAYATHDGTVVLHRDGRWLELDRGMKPSRPVEVALSGEDLYVLRAERSAGEFHYRYHLERHDVEPDSSRDEERRTRFERLQGEKSGD